MKIIIDKIEEAVAKGYDLEDTRTVTIECNLKAAIELGAKGLDEYLDLPYFPNHCSAIVELGQFRGFPRIIVDQSGLKVVRSLESKDDKIRYETILEISEDEMRKSYNRFK